MKNEVEPVFFKESNVKSNRGPDKDEQDYRVEGSYLHIGTPNSMYT